MDLIKNILMSLSFYVLLLMLAVILLYKIDMQSNLNGYTLLALGLVLGLGIVMLQQVIYNYFGKCVDSVKEVKE
jgi:hypothetical protein